MSAPVSAEKKKLQKFLHELLRVGTVKGFQHFSMHPRGREELICCVRNEALTATPGVSPAHSLSSSYEQRQSDLPRNQQSLLLSAGTQKRLSGYGFINVGLPPASPSDREVFHADKDTTVFLIAGYQRYSCPYIWVRSNHERLVRLSGSGAAEKDNPLKLRSTSCWSEKDVQPWDIIGELVQLCMQPSPVNPFAVDLSYFDSLPPSECALATGAMANLLQKLLLSRTHSYDNRVLEDLRCVLQLHFTAMGQAVTLPSQPDQQGQGAIPSERTTHGHSGPTNVQRQAFGTSQPSSQPLMPAPPTMQTQPHTQTYQAPGHFQSPMSSFSPVTQSQGNLATGHYAGQSHMRASAFAQVM